MFRLLRHAVKSKTIHAPVCPFCGGSAAWDNLDPPLDETSPLCVRCQRAFKNIPKPLQNSGHFKATR